jgi:hypothetical protein
LFVDPALSDITPDQRAVARRWRTMTARTRNGNIDDLASPQRAMALRKRRCAIA